MTTTQEPVGREGLTLTAARRLRGQLAERRISQKRFGELTGWGRGPIYLRLTGQVSLNLDEIEHIERTVGIPTALLIDSRNSQSNGWLSHLLVA